MTKKKRVVHSIVFTDKNELALQNMGFLNKRGKTTGRLNLCDFVNRAVAEKIGLDKPYVKEDIEERVIIGEIEALRKQRDHTDRDFEQRMRILAQKLAEVRAKRRPLQEQIVEAYVTEKVIYS